MPKTKSHRPGKVHLFFLLGIINCLLLLVLVLMPPRGINSNHVPGGRAAGRTFPERRPTAPGRSSDPERHIPWTAEGRGSAAGGGIPATGRVERPERLARLALVIDDVGYNLEGLAPFLSLPDPLTFAVLPHLPFSEEAARRIREAGKELLLHCPMEPANGEDPGPGALLTSHSREDILQRLEESFATVPEALGMNNHMGSRFTADERAMTVVMDYLKGQGKFFMDSRTTAESVGFRMARKLEVPVLERDVFLDHEPSRVSIEESLLEGVTLAKSRGFAILIGHIYHPEIAEVLAEAIPTLKRQGVHFTSLSELIAAEY